MRTCLTLNSMPMRYPHYSGSNAASEWSKSPPTKITNTTHGVKITPSKLCNLFCTPTVLLVNKFDFLFQQALKCLTFLHYVKFSYSPNLPSNWAVIFMVKLLLQILKFRIKSVQCKDTILLSRTPSKVRRSNLNSVSWKKRTNCQKMSQFTQMTQGTTSSRASGITIVPADSTQSNERM